MGFFDQIGPVPNLLIPYFRAGGLREVIKTAERFGTGLAFINEYRKKYPRDPRLPNADYMQLLSYLSKTAKAVKQAGKSIGQLASEGIISPDMFPRNFFVNPGSGPTDRYLFYYRYSVVNSQTNEIKVYTGYYWSNKLGQSGKLKGEILQAEQDRLNTISMSHPKGVKYAAVDGSIEILGIIKRY